MELINTAKGIASNAKFILKFAHVIAEQCADERLVDVSRVLSYVLFVCECIYVYVILLSHKLSEVFFCWLCSEVRVICSTMRNTCQLSAHS